MVDMLAHLWLPMVIVGLGSAAFTMRILRANLLDELNKPYVVTARAKGVGPVKLVLKYPVRIAINPFISNIGLMLPALVSGEALVSLVMGLPTIGPLLLQALLNQDMFLAGSLLMWLAVLTVVGILLSDLLRRGWTRGFVLSEAVSSVVIADAAQAGEDATAISPRRLMWLRFRRHRLALVSGAFLIAMYVLAAFASSSPPTGR